MPPRRVPSCVAALALLALSGCGYVHFGRMPERAPAAPVGDEQLLKDNASLRTEKKMLQQELALTRAQGDALRMAIENRTADGDTSKRLTEKLTQTTRELATLRADYLKLQSERAAAAQVRTEDSAEIKAKLAASEEKLANYLRNVTQLNEEIAGLKTDLNKARAENSALTDQVKEVTAKNAEVQAALAALNSELLTRKESLTRAEQDAATLRTQLDSANVKLSELAQQRTAAAGDARSLAAPETTSADPGDLRGQLESLRKKVWTLESERSELQQKLAAIEAAGKAPGLAELKAREETNAKLTAALQSAKMLRDENDQLKASVAQAAKAKAEVEADLAKAKALQPLAMQAGTLREQLTQAQNQAAQLIEENSRLKARLAVSAGAAGNIPPGFTPNPPAGAAPTAAPVTTPAGTGVTATLVTSVSGTSGSKTAPGITRSASGAIRYHTVASGDTLSKISTTYYGTPARWAEILVANRDLLGEDNNLVIGRQLRIP